MSLVTQRNIEGLGGYNPHIVESPNTMFRGLATIAIVVFGLNFVGSNQVNAASCVDHTSWTGISVERTCDESFGQGGGLQPGDWLALLSADGNSALDPIASVEKKLEQLKAIEQQVAMGRLMLSGRVINKSGGYDLFPVEILARIYQDDGNVFTIAVPFNSHNNPLKMSALDLAVTPQVLDLSGVENSYDLRMIALEHPEKFRLIVLEAEEISRGGAGEYQDYIKALHSKEGDGAGVDLTLLTAGQIAADIGAYVMEVENNVALHTLVNEIETRAVPVLNRLVRSSLRAEDFRDGKLPIVNSNGVDGLWFVFPEYNLFGGGYSGSLVSGIKPIIFGPYNDIGELRTNPMARINFSQVWTHEDAIHTLLQASSVHSNQSMGLSESHNNLTHNAMGFWEFASALANGYAVFPNDRAALVAGVLIDTGMSPEQVARTMLSLAVHGDVNNLVTDLYNASRDSGLPDMETLMTMDPSAVPDISDTTKIDQVLAAEAKLAGLGEPSKYTTFLNYQIPSSVTEPATDLSKSQLNR